MSGLRAGDISAWMRARTTRWVSDLEELVGIPTGWGDVEGLERARRWCIARAEALGASVERVQGDPRPDWLREGRTGDSSRDRGDVVVIRGGQVRADAAGPASAGAGAKPVSRHGSGLRVLIACHIDTVHDPRGGFRELGPDRGGQRCGPGAVDMKGGVVAAFAALEAVHALGVPLQWTLVLNADEEVGSFASMRALRALASQHDVGLVTEPPMADGAFVVSRPGAAQFRIDAVGRAAHAGRDFVSGISAVGLLAGAITSALEISDVSSGRTVNIGPLEGGDATNIVPDRASAWGAMRFRSRGDGEQMDRTLMAIARGHESDVPRICVRIAHNRPPKEATPEVLGLAGLAVACARELGVAVGAGTGSTGGVSDANVLQDAGLPCLDGLGVRGGNMHRTDEYIAMESLAERASLLALLLASLAECSSVPSQI
jgi:glutamate carboxypeptidase